MSYTTTYYHIVFRTYRSEMTIPEDHEKELYAYLYGAVGVMSMPGSATACATRT